MPLYDGRNLERASGGIVLTKRSEHFDQACYGSQDFFIFLVLQACSLQRPKVQPPPVPCTEETNMPLKGYPRAPSNGV